MASCVKSGALQVVPAPDIPPAAEQQWHRAQWVLYRLRRAYLDSPPTAPVQALASAGMRHVHRPARADAALWAAVNGAQILSGCRMC